MFVTAVPFEPALPEPEPGVSEVAVLAFHVKERVITDELRFGLPGVESGADLVA